MEDIHELHEDEEYGADGLNKQERFLKSVVEEIKGLRRSEDHLTFSHRKEIADMLEDQITHYPEVYSRLSDFRIPIEHKLKEMGGIKRTKNTIYKLTYKLINEFPGLQQAYARFKDTRKLKKSSKNSLKICSKCRGEVVDDNERDEEYWRGVGIVKAPLYTKTIPNVEPTKKEIAMAKEKEKALFQVFEQPNYVSIIDRPLQ